MSPSSKVCGISQVTKGKIASDGAGVRLTRLIGGADIPMVDPFLMLDFFGSDKATDYIAGFPDHPHRGFETVTYMLAGRMRHKDSTGHEDVIGPGDIQWMTAGRGLVHSEMPEQSEGLMKGFQLWVNLPASEKMTAPKYRAVTASCIPVEKLKGNGTVKVIAGITDNGTDGPIKITTVKPLFFDVNLDSDGTFSQTMPEDHSGFIYIIDGGAYVGDDKSYLPMGTLGVLDAGDRVVVESGAEPARFLLIAGQAIGEPVVKYGPFVMNTNSEIMQAIDDYQNGRFTD